MSVEREYASKGIAGTGLGLGIAGTALGLMNNSGGCNNGGLLGNILGGGRNDCYATKFELQQSELIGQKDAEIAFYKSQDITNTKISDALAYTNNQITLVNNAIAQNAITAAENKVRFECLEKQVVKNTYTIDQHSQELKAQATYNGVMTERVGCIQRTVDELTKVVVPSTNVCENPILVQLAAQMANLTNAVAAKK